MPAKSSAKKKAPPTRPKVGRARTESSAPSINQSIDKMTGGIVIGELNVKEAFFIGSQSMPSDLRGKIDDFRQFYSLVFGGRDQEMAALNRWLSQSNNPIGLFIAPAGKGKSALLANWISAIQKSSAAKVVYHPISSRYGTDDLADIVWSLVEQLREIDGENDPSGKRWDIASLESELYLRLNSSEREKSPVIVVLDGLDELQSAPRRYPKLPVQVTNGVHLLVSVRGDIEKDKLDWRNRLGWQESQIEYFTVGSLGRSGIVNLLRHSSLPLADSAFQVCVDQVYYLSEEGDPLIASLLIRNIKDNAPSSEISASQIEQILSSKKPGMGSYIEGILTKLEENNYQFAQTLFDALCIARGPLFETDLNKLGVTLSPGLYDISRLSGRLIIGDGVGQGFSFSHSKIATAYGDKHLIGQRRSEWQKRFHAYGKQTLLRVLDGDLPSKAEPKALEYVLRHYSTHLYEDGSEPNYAGLYELINEKWMRAHYLKTDSYDSFLADVTRVAEAAQIQGEFEAKNNKRVLVIEVLTKCALCFSSIATLAGKLPPSLPAVLARDKVWEVRNALEYISRIPDIISRCSARLSLLEEAKSLEGFSPRDHSSSALSLISDLSMLKDKDKEDLCGQLLLRTISHLVSEGEIEAALEQINTFRSKGWQIRLLAHLISKISDSHRKQLALVDLLRMCSLPGTNTDAEAFRPYIFMAVAENLPKDVFAASLDVAFNVDHLESGEQSEERKHILESRCRLLMGLARYVPAELTSGFLDACLSSQGWDSYHGPSLPKVLILLSPRLLQNEIRRATYYLLDSGIHEHSLNLKLIGGDWLTSPCIALLVLAHFSSEPELRITILSRVKQKLGEFISWNTERPVDDLRYVLCKYIAGEYSDEDCANLVLERQIEFHYDDHPLFCVLGPNTIKAICLEGLGDLGPYGREVRASADFLRNMAHSLANEDLDLVMTVAGDGEFLHFEEWGRLRAIAAIAERLSSQQVEPFIKFAIGTNYHSDFDSRLEALRSLAEGLRRCRKITFPFVIGPCVA